MPSSIANQREARSLSRFARTPPTRGKNARTHILFLSPSSVCLCLFRMVRGQCVCIWTSQPRWDFGNSFPVGSADASEELPTRIL